MKSKGPTGRTYQDPTAPTQGPQQTPIVFLRVPLYAYTSILHCTILYYIIPYHTTLYRTILYYHENLRHFSWKISLIYYGIYPRTLVLGQTEQRPWDGLGAVGCCSSCSCSCSCTGYVSPCVCVYMHIYIYRYV